MNRLKQVYFKLYKKKYNHKINVKEKTINEINENELNREYETFYQYENHLKQSIENDFIKFPIVLLPLMTYRTMKTKKNVEKTLSLMGKNILIWLIYSQWEGNLIKKQYLFDKGKHPMIPAVNSTISALQAYKTQMDVASNNVANINTENYKKSRVNLKLRPRLRDPPGW